MGFKCDDCGGLVGRDLHCCECGKNYGGPEASPYDVSDSNDSLDDTSSSGDYKELRGIRRALDQNNEHLQKSNEHLQKIRVYIGWFWWILIGIPLLLIIFAIIASIKFESMKKERQLEQEQQQEQSGQGTD